MPKVFALYPGIRHNSDWIVIQNYEIGSGNGLWRAYAIDNPSYEAELLMDGSHPASMSIAAIILSTAAGCNVRDGGMISTSTAGFSSSGGCLPFSIAS